MQANFGHGRLGQAHRPFGHDQRRFGKSTISPSIAGGGVEVSAKVGEGAIEVVVEARGAMGILHRVSDLILGVTDLLS
jgi:phosphoribosyl-ATP pyrophosphohydrolase